MSEINAPIITKPIVGGDLNVWGAKINVNYENQKAFYDDIVNAINYIKDTVDTTPAELQALLDQGAIMIVTLDQKILDVGALINELDQATANGTVVKDELEPLVTSGTALNSDLEQNITDGTVLKGEIEGLIAGGDLIQKGTGFDSVKYPDAKAITDAVEGNTGQLKNLSVGYMFNSHKFLELPSDFIPTLPCDFWRDSNNDIRHNMKFDNYKGGTQLFVDLDNGNDITGNGSTATPYKTINKAFEVASVGTDPHYDVIVRNTTPFLRDESRIDQTITDKTISLYPEDSSNRIVMLNAQRGLAWTQDGNGTWYTSRNSTYSVFDFDSRDSDGVHIPYEAKNSIAECQAQAGTWYTDGSLVYVHTSDEVEPTAETIAVCISTGVLEPRILGTSKLYIENVDFVSGRHSNGCSPRGDNTTVGEFCAKNCSFVGGNLRYDRSASSNALAIIDIKNTYLFDCVSSYAKRDNFSYHHANIPNDDRRDCFALEYNCKGKNAGVYSSEDNNNITTAHEGISILRIGTIGDNASIPLIDVGGCYSICIDCDMSIATFTQGTYFFGDDAGKGKSFVVNCVSDGDQVGLNTRIDTYVYGFTGNINDTGFQNILA